MSAEPSDRVSADTQRRLIVQSLMMKALREQLSWLSRELRIPFVFVKGAFSDPVLYGGRGERFVSDVDLLVPERELARVASALRRLDYERVIYPEHRFSNDRSKEWTLNPRDGRGLTIDLHRGLANRPYALDDAALIARARYYDSVDGRVLSLEPTDQVLYTAVHYANHGFALDGRHLEDTRRLVARFPVDWVRAERQAAAGGFAFALRRILVALSAPRARDLRIDRLRTALLARATRIETSSFSTALRWVATGLATGRPLHPLHAASSYAYGRVGDFIVGAKGARQ